MYTLSRQELQEYFRSQFKDEGIGYKELKFKHGYLVRHWEGKQKKWIVDFMAADAYWRYKTNRRDITKKTLQTRQTLQTLQTLQSFKRAKEQREQNEHLKSIMRSE